MVSNLYSDRGMNRFCCIRGFTNSRNVLIFFLAAFVFLPGSSGSKVLYAYACQSNPIEQRSESTSAQVQEQLISVDVPEQQGQLVQIDRFELEYVLVDHPQQPPLSEIMQMNIVLSRTENGYVKAQPGMPSEYIQLANVESLSINYFYFSAIQSIEEQVIAYLNSQGLIGILVMPHERDFDIYQSPPRDLREGSQGPLRFKIWTGIVKQLRTIAVGDRLPADARIDHPLHQRIKDRSPVQPFVATPTEPTPTLPINWPREVEEEPAESKRKDLLRKDLLDDYLYFLNRHPGRQADVAVSSLGEPGEVAMDFLVMESKPWLAYFQISNTGTEETSRWRERFGFINNQFSGNDDILNIDYITAGFNEAHALVASYEAPLLNWDRIRWQVQGLASEYDASEVGFASEIFHGEEWNVGGAIEANVFQYKEIFIDVVAGIRHRNITVKNEIIGIEGEEDFFLPRIGFNIERKVDTSSTFGTVNFEWNDDGIANTDAEEVIKLGRLETDADWQVIHWSLMHTFYLDPILYGEKWEKPEPDDNPNLIHEIVLNFNGQYTKDRLIPQAMYPVGGMYTVRGYPETVATGDSVIAGNAEYRYHIPRAFKIEREPRKIFRETTFRWAPQQAYSQPDWDLAVRCFFDIAQFRNSDRLFTEEDKTLMGYGIGLELLLYKNFSIRCDWGFVIEPFETADDNVDRGDNRFHIMGIFAF